VELDLGRRARLTGEPQPAFTGDSLVDMNDHNPGVRCRHAQEPSTQGIEMTVHMREVLVGPARSIAEIATEENADLIVVVGTRGRSGVAGILLCSVTQRLLHLAHRPVLSSLRRLSTLD